MKTPTTAEVAALSAPSINDAQREVAPSDEVPSTAALNLTDDELADAAKRAASSVQRLVALWHVCSTPDHIILRTARRITTRHQVELPGKASLPQILNRLCDAAWWRKALRKRFRAAEYVELQEGRVHRRAAPYVSDKAMKRALRDRRRIAELLAALDAVNQTTGEILPLEDLVEQSLANPSNRRKAMMARIKGIEEHAKSKGHEALFFTITCPSRMHPRHWSGDANERHDGSSPRQAHTYLNKLWRRAMRKLQHDGVTAYGLRVVEPHHDACPHWHVLTFTAPKHTEQLIQTLRGYALCDSPDEPGAAEHRFTVERIDPAKGSAVGYVAKYVSKSIDGEGVTADEESDAPGAAASQRIVTWSRVWGIRQFQFFGTPPITPTRELYRVDRLGVESQGLQAAHQACKANDYGAWLAACEAYGLRFKVTYAVRQSSRYPDELSQRIEGLTAQGGDLTSALQLTTRTDEWRIEPRAKTGAEQAAGVPWTRFNNCAPVDSIEIFGMPQQPAPETTSPNLEGQQC